MNRYVAMACIAFALFSQALTIAYGQPMGICGTGSCDEMQSSETECDELPGDEIKQWVRREPSIFRFCDCERDTRWRTPAMIGDFFGGTPLGIRADSVIDRLMVIADDLDAPLPLPDINQVLTISEPGPVGVFSSTIQSVQHLQSLYRAGSPIPTTTLEGSINSNATLTTQNSIAAIQTQLAATGLAYDIILVAAPPGSYNTAVTSIMNTRNGIPGTTIYDPTTSGALIQGGVDTLDGGEDLDAFYFYNYLVRINSALTDAVSGGVGRLKLAEGGAVLPQNRVYFRYGGVSNVRYNNSTTQLNRFVPGFERSFWGGLASLEVRAPLATDAISQYTANGQSVTNGEHTRFGNLTFYGKALLHSTSTIAISGGLGIALPTAQNTSIDYLTGEQLLRVSNESVHLRPFLGGLYTPNDRFFSHAFIEYDVATNGNSVAINTGSGLASVGRLTDANHLFIDAGVGYWLYRSNGRRGVTGIIPTLELHQTVSTGRGGTVSAGPFQVGNFNGSTSITTLVAGTTVEMGQRTQLIAGYVAPLGGGSDRQFDGALQVHLQRALGR